MFGLAEVEVELAVLAAHAEGQLGTVEVEHLRPPIGRQAPRLAHQQLHRQRQPALGGQAGLAVFQLMVALVVFQAHAGHHVGGQQAEHGQRPQHQD